MKKVALIPVITIIAFFMACAEGDKRQVDEGESLIEEAAAPIKEHHEKAYYPIPSPEQMFGFINDNGIAYSKDLISGVDQIENYVSPVEKALNFGVYTADLAYAAAYEDIESTIDLYKIVRRLGDELNIEDMITDEMMGEIQSNMENPDSLVIIAGDSYYQAVEFLEENGEEGKLALMSLGGWIESLYITMSSLEEFDSQSESANRIASQKITFGNLYTYLKKNEEEIGVSEALKNVQEIRSVFASLVEERSAKSTRNASGKLVLGRGSKIVITEEQFEQLKASISAYRQKIVGEAS